MNTPAERMKAILNFKPPNKIRIPMRELKTGDLIAGDEVTRVWQDEFFVHFWTKGRGSFQQGNHPGYEIEVERKKK